jgi:hypothetical protein
MYKQTHMKVICVIPQMYIFLLFMGFIASLKYQQVDRSYTLSNKVPQYPLGTPEKYKSRILVMKDGMKIGLTERQGGGNGGAEVDGLWSKNKFGEGFGPPNPSNRSDAEIIAHIAELLYKKAILDVLQNEQISINIRADRATKYLEEDIMSPNITKGGLYKDWNN